MGSKVNSTERLLEETAELKVSLSIFVNSDQFLAISNASRSLAISSFHFMIQGGDEADKKRDVIKKSYLLGLIPTILLYEAG